MSRYIVDLSYYGLTLFLVGVVWGVLSVLLQKKGQLRLLLRGKSYDSQESDHRHAATVGR